LLRLALCLAVIAATVIGCGWPISEHSVRFGVLRGIREFGRLPPLPVNASGAGRKQPPAGHDEADQELAYEIAAQQRASLETIWQQANDAEKEGDLAQARQLLREYRERGKNESDHAWNEPDYQRERRNSAIDRLDAMTALDQGAPKADVQIYLNARRAYHCWLTGDDDTAPPISPLARLKQLTDNAPNPELANRRAQYAGDLQRVLSVSPRDSRLADNFAYLRAAFLYRQGEMDQAARAFNQLAAQYPRSEKREVALFMTGVAAMKKSCAPRPPHGSANSNEADAYACDDTWTAAHAAFQRVLREYPRGNYARDARGWMAYLLLHSDDHAGALVEYYRLLSDAPDDAARYNALISLRMVRGDATEEEMQRVEAQLADEPAAALTYAYHNIFNYSSSAGYYELDYRDSNTNYETWRPNIKHQEKVRKAAMAEAQRKELARVAAFATRLMQRYPQTAVSGAFALRVAQADLELGEIRAARKLAERALKLGVRADERAEALWVKGVAAYQLRDYQEARRTLTTLVNEFPNGDLMEGARRLLAMAAEDVGDLDAALEQYLALKYQDDVAYFVDVLMTPEQLAGFIERHPRAEQRDELLYGLGVRYLREWRWDEARAAFARVQTVEGRDQWFSFYDSGRRVSAKEFGRGYGSEPGVLVSWILRDVQTINDLERLQRTAEEAVGDEAKAEALYQLASYVYEERALLFYNPAAWRGARTWKLYYLAQENNFRAPGEAQALWSYLQSHDYPARALPLYLEVARRFPNTRAARDALYTAAVCQERLSNFNGYWRDIYEQGLHAGERMVTYGDVKAAYPKYQLPRATLGWEPSTRTVNGGPGWEAPPKPLKPKPRPTWRMRVKHRLASLQQQTTMVWQETVRPWLIGGIAAVAALSVCYLAFIVAITIRQRRERVPAPEIITLSLHSPAASAPEPESKVERIINSR
jgi:TolA-binding protein